MAMATLQFIPDLQSRSRCILAFYDEMEFEFSSKMTSFFSYGDYFRGYSEGYECHIEAELYVEDAEDDDEPMILEYKNGEIIHGVSEYGFEGEDF